jgi:diguanylate cyclase (GGDEF)-like protein
MKKGWSQSEISAIISRLNQVEPAMKIRVFRGDAVIQQFGELEGEEALRQSDPGLRRALAGEELLFPNSEMIRYLYPIRVTQECLRCHTSAKVGDVNGVVDITFPVKDLKVSLEFVTSVVIGYFILVLVLLFLVLYLSLRTLIARPVRKLTHLMVEVTQHTDLTRRIGQGSWVREVKHLSAHFNRLLASLQAYNRQLEDLTIRDPLTNLYNRRRFERFLDFEVKRGRRHDFTFCVVLLDMDNFKHINDTFGHPIGDLALREIGILLQEQLRGSDILARLGGDEFAIILPDTSPDQGLATANKLHHAVNTTDLELPVGKTRIVASFGVVCFPECGENSDALFAAMDVAMYKAKRMGKNCVMAFDDREQQVMQDVFSKGEFVRKALEEDRLLPYLQPIVDAKTGKLFAYEALARIVDGKNVTEAGTFINTAEEVGLAQQIDSRVIEQVLRIKSDPRLSGVRMFCNLSSRSFGNVNRMRELVDRMEAQGLPLNEMVFEITEREALPHLSELRALTDELRQRGVAFALDDFGSGFSSFLYLKYLNVDYVKIEGSFVRSLAADQRDRTIVDHINRMAQEFHLRTIAEFVEDEETMAILNQLGIDYAQGYFTGRPQEFS